LWSFYMEQVIPETLLDPQNSQIAIVGTGALSYDIYPGPFTVGDAYTTSPYGNFWLLLEGIPGASLSKLLSELNQRSSWWPRGGQRIPSYMNSSSPQPFDSYDLVFCDFDTQPITEHLTKIMAKSLHPRVYKPMSNTSSVLTQWFQHRPCTDGLLV